MRLEPRSSHGLVPGTAAGPQVTQATRLGELTEVELDRVAVALVRAAVVVPDKDATDLQPAEVRRPRFLSGSQVLSPYGKSPMSLLRAHRVPAKTLKDGTPRSSILYTLDLLPPAARIRSTTVHQSVVIKFGAMPRAPLPPAQT